MKHKRLEQCIRFLALCLSFSGVVPAVAQRQTTVEMGGTYHHLTAKYPAWNGVYLRATLPSSDATTLGAEVTNQGEFGDRGSYFGLSVTHVLNPDWHVFGSVGTSAGGLFYPRVRVDGAVNRKWLEKRQLVTSVGGGYYAAKDIHSDFNLSAGAVYYFQQPWIVEGGVRWNRSSPGSVISRFQFIAVNAGEANKHYLIFRAGFGQEAYQLIGPSTTLVDFKSQVFTATYRKWLSAAWGVSTSVEFYHNPIYQRAGSSLGVFRTF
jgi:YaiO family outer membrane protein